jgi:aryl-alcohol dehydrogenase-like predicted oxidoreductase
MRSVSLLGGRLHTSRLGFGTSSIHHLRSARDRASILDHCFSSGVRYFDTAPLYGHELAERELGRFLRSRRGDVAVATKFGIPSHRWLAQSTAVLYAGLAARSAAARAGLFPAGRWKRDYGAQPMVRSLERSLKNLQTDHVDLYLAHDPSAESCGFTDELVGELERIRAAGKARFIGLAGQAADCLAIAKKYPRVADVLQIEAGTPPRLIAQLKCAGFEPTITFGYFRPAVQDMPGAGRAEVMRRRIEFAALDNPAGVILFSARSVARIDETLAIFGAIDCAEAG